MFGNHKGALRIKRPFLVFLGLMLFCLTIFLAVSAYYLQNHYLEKEVRKELNKIQRLYHLYLDLEANHIESFLNFYGAENALQEAFAAGSRQELLKIANPIYKRLRAEQDITHFYFITPDLSCFLRVHNPLRYGDLIDRHTLKEAAEKDTISHGIELGIFGTFTLRVVSPWYIGGKLAGYLELGKEIEHITPDLKKIMGYELFFLVNKRFLTLENWLEGLAMIGRQGHWNEVPNHVVVDRTLAHLPAGLHRYIGMSHAEKENLVIRTSQKGRELIGGFTPLRDASGREVGEIIAIGDFTTQVSGQKITTVMLAICFLGFILIYSLFHIYVNFLDSRLSKTYKNLQAEIIARKETEEKLRQNEEDLENEVRDRTAELKEMNKQLQQEILEREKTQAELKKSNDELENRVKERTAELEQTHQQLLHAEKLSAIGKLSSSIAHEFNSPLCGVINVLNNLKKRVILDEANSELVDLAIKEGNRMQNLIKDLQNFKRPTSGRFTKVDIHQSIKNILRMYQEKLGHKDISITENLADDLPHIDAIPDQVQQVLLNLLNNAYDACSDGDSITIATEFSDSTVTIHIKDTGSGIKAEDMDHIFEPFFSTKPEASGTGLGLSVTYGIVKRHGGTVDVTSEYGRGTQIIVTLPIEATHE